MTSRRTLQAQDLMNNVSQVLEYITHSTTASVNCEIDPNNNYNREEVSIEDGSDDESELQLRNSKYTLQDNETNKNHIMEWLTVDELKEIHSSNLHSDKQKDLEQSVSKVEQQRLSFFLFIFYFYFLLLFF